ncbi:MAG: sensor domain-containing diguanylate cyclase [Solirubrobacteraceae bacterium]
MSTQPELQHERDLLAQLFDSAPIGAVVATPDSCWIRVNRALCEMLGYGATELRRLGAQGVLHPDEVADYRDCIAQMLAGEVDTIRRETRWRDSAGATVWVRLNAALIRDEGGAPQHFLVQVEDITARRHTEDELRAAQEHAESIVAAMREGYGLIVDGRIRSVNEALCELTGFAAEQLIGAAMPFPFWPPEEMEAIEAQTEAIVAQKGGTFELTLMRAGGTRFFAEITARVARRSDGSVLGYVNTIRDVSERRLHEAELQRMARTDSLTGLPNHRTFHEHLVAAAARAARSGEPLSVAVLDLDHFKQVNDRHGHLTGDEVLREVGVTLTSLVRAGELIARVGGEEFAWLLPGADELGAFAAAERARQAIRDGTIDPVGRITLSAGVCELAHATGATDLYARADQALYRAKRAGRDRTSRSDAAPQTGTGAS